MNADQRLIHEFRRHPTGSCAVDSNPMAIALGMRLLEVGDDDAVTLSFLPDPLFIQGTNVLQGGAVTAMLDFAMAFSVLAGLPAGASCATVNLTTAFLRAAPHGAYLARGWIERKGRTLAFAQASLAPAEAPRSVVATATSTLSIR